MNDPLMNFPSVLRNEIASIRAKAGILSAKNCQRICEQLEISIESLMVKLLPLAASYSNPRISSYPVGAVALGLELDEAADESAFSDLYLGANIEYQSLYFSVHAEQAAVSNAWSDGKSSIKSIAVSAAPCGHCRQFLYEVTGNKPLQIILPATNAPHFFSLSKQKDTYAYADLSDILPAAFGPLDLGCEHFLMAPNPEAHPLTLEKSNDSERVKLALQAAHFSYAPYTSNFAGCAIQLISGKIHSGRYAENAAHNPSFSPFSAALSKTMLGSSTFNYQDIQRVVLVEQPTTISQKEMVSQLLKACNPDIELEYHLAFTKFVAG